MLERLNKSRRRAEEAAERIYGSLAAHPAERAVGRAGLLLAALIGSLFGRREVPLNRRDRPTRPLCWSDQHAGLPRVDLDCSARGGSSAVWLNLTSSHEWCGPDNGIIRVERQLARELGGAVGAVRMHFCRWKRGSFHACDAAGNTAGPCDVRPCDWLVSAGLDWGNGSVDHFLRLRRERQVRLASFCYDVIPFLFPQHCHRATVRNFPPYFLKLAASSEVMFSISENTRRDAEQVLREAGAPVPRMEVVRLGDNLPSTAGLVRPEIRKLCGRKFMLYVSTIERRKNHQVLYHALRLMRQSSPEESVPLLVFAGKQGWGTEDLLSDIALDPVTRGYIELLHGASDAELAELYRHAVCCLFPSYYEGWGLPVAEALAHGKVVLASNTSSIPEIGGDLVTYVDPLNPREWARAMEDVMTNPEARAAREAAVRNGYRPHAWSATAGRVAELLT